MLNDSKNIFSSFSQKQLRFQDCTWKRFCEIVVDMNIFEKVTLLFIGELRAMRRLGSSMPHETTMTDLLLHYITVLHKNLLYLCRISFYRKDLSNLVRSYKTISRGLEIAGDSNKRMRRKEIKGGGLVGGDPFLE